MVLKEKWQAVKTDQQLCTSAKATSKHDKSELKLVRQCKMAEDPPSGVDVVHVE